MGCSGRICDASAWPIDIRALHRVYDEVHVSLDASLHLRSSVHSDNHMCS